MNARRRRKSNPARRIVIMKNARRRRSKNPSFMGSSVKPLKMLELVAAGAVSMGLNSVILAALPAELTSNNFVAAASSAVLALLMGWGTGFMDKELGAAVAFGGLMNSTKMVINSFIPQVGSAVGLSGRGHGDFVGGKFAVPQNPVMDGNMGVGGPMGGGVVSAYPRPYAAAA